MTAKDHVGKVTHFFPKISVAVVSLSKGKLKLGDRIRIEKGDESFEQKVVSMQMEHEKLKEAKKGQDFGLKVDKETKPGALVFKL